MKEYDLELTNENIKYSIEKDLLDRNRKLNKLIELLNGINGNKIISLNGKWGSGKTFFLKQLEFINKENFNLNNKFEEKNINKFKENYVVYYYNAWENDLHCNPLLSLIYNLINDFPIEKSQNASGKVELPFNVIDCLKTLSFNFFDLNKIKSYQDLTSEICTFEKKKKALNNIINNILPINKKLVLIIDELDRCKPDYAINMLETIKHFYLNDNVIFLLGTNNLQLSYTISNYYGSGFDGYGYLNKIYNLVIEMEEFSTNDYLQKVIGRYNDSSWSNIGLYSVCEYFNFSMREINRLVNDFDFLNEYMITSNNGIFSEDMVVKYLFLPYCLGLKVVNKIELSNFLNGIGFSSLKKYVYTNEETKNILKYCFEQQNRNKKIELEEDLLKEMDKYLEEKYTNYFINKTTDWDVEKNKKKFLDIFSLLSNYSKINDDN